MKKLILLLALVLPSTLAIAQQEPSASEKSLAAKLMKELQEGLSCNTNLISVQAELMKAQAKIKELETKRD